MFGIPDDDIFLDDFPLDDEISDQKRDGCTAVVCLKGSNKGLTVEHSRLTDADLKNRATNDVSKMAGVGVPKKGKRKFPGPAGILPPSTPSSFAIGTSCEILNFQSHASSPRVVEANNEICSLPLSQSPSEDIFTSPLWAALVSDLGPDAQILLSKFSIKSMLLKASRKLLHRGKIPLIIGLIESLQLQGSDASFVIRDTTGKMNGSLHRDLVKDPVSAIQAGSVLVLRQVSVISPSSRTHYLNVTPANVFLVYSTNRDARISKQLWSPASVESKLHGKDIAQVPCFKQVIEQSEKELLMSLKYFQQSGSTNGCTDFSSTFNISTSNVLGLKDEMNSSLFRFKSPAISSSIRPSHTMERGCAATAQTHVLFNKTIPSRELQPCGNNSSLSTSPVPALMNCTRSVHDPNRVISGARAVRTSSGSVMSSNCLSHWNQTAAANSDTYGYEKHIHNDFPNDDDDMIFKLCDEILSPTQDGSTLKYRTTEKYISSSSKGLDGCKQENLHSNYGSLLSNSKIDSNVRDNFSIRENCDKNCEMPCVLSSNVTSSSSGVKKCSFKRTLPISSLPVTAPPPCKCPMQENQNQSELWFSGNIEKNTFQRDSRIELGKQSIDGPTENKTDFPLWDDDLNDDFILSQLSEEF